MSNLQFDDGESNVNYQFTPASQKGMVGWLVKKGIAPDQKTAEIILIVAAVIIFGASLIVFRGRNTSPTSGSGDFIDEEYYDEFYNDDFGAF